MMSATARRSAPAIKRAEDSGAVLFGRPRLFIAAAVGHGLATARLFLRVYDVDPQFFEQLESGDANLWIKHVNVAGDHKCDLHRPLTSKPEIVEQSRNLRAFQACRPSSKQAQCHREVLVPKPARGMRAQTESR